MITNHSIDNNNDNMKAEIVVVGLKFIHTKHNV